MTVALSANAARRGAPVRPGRPGSAKSRTLPRETARQLVVHSASYAMQYAAVSNSDPARRQCLAMRTAT
jgi:hypothetical protein